MGYNTPYAYFKQHIEKYNKLVNNREDLNEEQKKKMLLPIIPLHGLRHSCATLLNHLGVEILYISDILGHAQTSTTMNIYAHSFESQKRVASDRLDAFLIGNV